MHENEEFNLDTEFKRYLQIMRPYLAQLMEQDVIELCNAWIHRLSNCSEQERSLRNKYVFALCYQLAKGVLDEPFLKYPTATELPPISDELDSDQSNSEGNITAVVSEEDITKECFVNKTSRPDTDSFLKDTDDLYNKNKECNNIEGNQNDKKSAYNNGCTDDLQNYDGHNRSSEYKLRAYSVVLKLREIKTENFLLHNEIEYLRRELDTKVYKLDCSTSTCFHENYGGNYIIINSLEKKVQELHDTEKVLLQTIDGLKENLSNYDNVKRQEVELIEAKHKIEIDKVKTETREESKILYENKVELIKQHYEKTIGTLQNKEAEERKAIISLKDDIIAEHEKNIHIKNVEIEKLKALIEDQKSNFHDTINKFIEKPKECLHTEAMKMKAEQLEKRLSKVEKSRLKCIRMYEAKLTNLQKEKHLAECSFQLQLAKQRAQVVNEVMDESQSELNTALSKLEDKYKEIVASMQATAIQRRIQDQMALETILHAACNIRSSSCTNGANRSQFSSKTVQNQNRTGNQMNQSHDSEISALLHGNKVDNFIGVNKSLDGSVMSGYCLDGERFGELFERVYIPQRDIGDGPLKK